MNDGSQEGDEPTGDASGTSVKEDETSDALVPPVFEFPDDVGAADSEFVQTVSTTLWAAVQVLFEQRLLQAPVLTVLLTDDIMGSADSEGTRIGIGPDRRSGVERVGGVVAGKALMSDDSTEAVVLISKETLGPNDGFAQLQAAIGLGHEFSHILYGAVRNATVGISPDRWLPWEMAEVMALEAAEEYRCDRLALLLIDPVITATDDRGERIALGAVLGGSYIDGMTAALDAVSPGMEDTILRYRTHQITLQQMWNEVAKISEEILLYVSHAEAHSDLDDSLLLGTIEHRGESLLKPIATPLFRYLRTTSLLPDAGEWAEDRKSLKRIGRDGLMAMWGQLGLHPRPQGGSFYLEVRGPGSLRPDRGTAHTRA